MSIKILPLTPTLQLSHDNRSLRLEPYLIRYIHSADENSDLLEKPALAPPRLSGRLVLPAMAEKIIFSGGLSRSYIPPAGRLLFYVVTICPSAVHPVGCYYFTNSNNYQSSIPSEWNVDAECPRRYSKVFVYYNCVFTSTEKSNFVAVWNLVVGGTCITGNTVTI